MPVPKEVSMKLDALDMGLNDAEAETFVSLIQIIGERVSPQDLDELAYEWAEAIPFDGGMSTKEAILVLTMQLK